MGLQTSAKQGILKKEWGERIDPCTVYRRLGSRTEELAAVEAAVKAAVGMEMEAVATVRPQGMHSLSSRTSIARPTQGKKSRVPPRNHLHHAGVQREEWV